MWYTRLISVSVTGRYHNVNSGWDKIYESYVYNKLDSHVLKPLVVVLVMSELEL